MWSNLLISGHEGIGITLNALNLNYKSAWPFSFQPVSCEVSEVLVIAWVAVGGSGVTLAVKPAALQRRLLVPDADGAHLRAPQPPSRDLTTGLTCFDNVQPIIASCGQCTVRLQFHGIPN